MSTSVERARRALEAHFGHRDFRPGQRGVVEALLAGRDALAVMPTGAGKSVCYQVPGVVMDGTTLVVSPLVSLMGDQVRSLQEAGVRAAYLNSTLSVAQQEAVLLRASAGEYDLMYVAPERLDDPRFAEFARTARLLGLRDPHRVVTGFDRPNLRFSVERLEPARKLARIIAHAKARPQDSGVVYCSTRKNVEKVHEALRDAGVSAVRYHAGLDKAERLRNQREWINDDAVVMVATNAFGMGIDKSNVRYVIHYNMPASMEAYYQEAGRAGRDGLPSECMLFWSDGDLSTCRFFLEQDSENDGMTPEEAQTARAARRRMLAAMEGYCLTCDCLRGYMLGYFGDEGLATSGRVRAAASASAADDAQAIGREAGATSEPGAGAAPFAAASLGAGCGNCSNCDGGFKAVDVSFEARAVMRCVQELRGRFGKGVVVDVLRGANLDKLEQLGLERAACLGQVDMSAVQLKEVVELLAAGSYLEITEGKFPLVGFGPRFREAAQPGFQLFMKQVERKPKARFSASGARVYGASGSAGAGACDEGLFERLRALRKRLAQEAGIAPYMVFSDATLRDMCDLLPESGEEFLEVNGVGSKKLDAYGGLFLEEIASWKKEGGGL